MFYNGMAFLKRFPPFVLGIALFFVSSSAFGAASHFSGTGTETIPVHLEAGLWFVTFNVTTPDQLESVTLDLLNDSGGVVWRLFNTAFTSESVSKTMTRAVEVSSSGDYVLQVYTHTEYYADWELTIIAGSEITPVDPPDDRYSFSGIGTQAGDLVRLEAGLWFVTFNLTTPDQLENVDVHLLDDAGSAVWGVFGTAYTSNPITKELTRAIEVPTSGNYVLQVYTHTYVIG